MLCPRVGQGGEEGLRRRKSISQESQLLSGPSYRAVTLWRVQRYDLNAWLLYFIVFFQSMDVPHSHAWMRHPRMYSDRCPCSCVTPTCLRADRAYGREGRRSQAALWKGGRGSQQALAAPRPKRAAEGPCGRGHGFSICGARRHRAEPAAKEIWMVLGRVVA